MRIKKMEKETRKKFLNYLIKKCDKFILTKYNDQHSQKNKEILNIITSNSKFLKEIIINNYSKKLIDVIYDKFKNDASIFNQEYINLYECYVSEYNNSRKMVINSAINQFVYEYNCNSLIKKYEKSLIEKKKFIENTQQNFGEVPFSRIDYIFSINSQTQKLLDSKDLYEWIYPYALEDLTLVNHDYLEFFSISHEEQYDIFCKDKQEYEYFKSIGVEFFSDCYESEEKIKYEDYSI